MTSDEFMKASPAEQDAFLEELKARINSGDLSALIIWAYASSIRTMQVLGRPGVTLSPEQRQQIQAMMEAGDEAGAQRAILDELQQQMGGEG